MQVQKKKWITLLAWLSACAMAIGMSACKPTETPSTSESSSISVESSEDVLPDSAGEDSIEESTSQEEESSSEETSSGEEEEEKISGLGLRYHFIIDEESGEEYYVLRSMGECLDSDLVIPSEYKGLPVKGIHAYAFQHCSLLTSVSIPDTVSMIDESAFEWCMNLKTVTFRDSAEDENTIEVVPAETLTIGENAFAYCLVLEEISIPETVTSIAKNTFYWCCDLVEVSIPETVTSIAEGAFFRCINLTNVVLPEGLETLGEKAFYYCESLTSVNLPQTLTAIPARAFAGCYRMETLALPDSVQSIGNYAFANCSALTSMALPKSLNALGEYVFTGCFALSELTISAANTAYKTIDGNLYNIDGTVLLQYATASEVTEFILPETVQTIGKGACASAINLTSVLLPDSVTIIEENAFLDCRNLATVDLGAGMTVIGDSAFRNCTSITSLVLPASLRKIENCAFVYCKALADIYFVGEADDFRHVYKIGLNNEIKSATLYGYSEEEPTYVEGEEQNFWHYGENGEVLAWKIPLPPETEEIV